MKQAANEAELAKKNFGIPNNANAPDRSYLPAVRLPDVDKLIRATRKQQESARVVMETRIIQNLIHSYY
jgi:hypothetical protein